MTVLLAIPYQLGRGLNDRVHWRARNERKKAERESVAWALVGKTKPATPCVLTITRLAPGNGLDDDNLAGACKNVRDELAAWMGVDDRHRDIVRYEYANERGPWGIRVEVA